MNGLLILKVNHTSQKCPAPGHRPHNFVEGLGLLVRTADGWVLNDHCNECGKKGPSIVIAVVGKKEKA